MTTFPPKIKFKSDDTELNYISETKKGIATYQYTKSKTKNGMQLVATIEQVNKLLKDKLIETE